MFAKLSLEQTLTKARSHVKRDEILEAQKLYQAVLLMFPKNVRARQGLDALNKFEQSNIKQSPPEEIVNELVNLYNQEKFLIVVEQAQAIVKQYPKVFIFWNILGASLAQTGKLDEAIEAYNKALSIKPDYADAYSNMGVALKDQGRLDEAIEAYKKVLSINPNYVDAYYNMGNAFQDQGKLTEAIEAYKKALSLKPDYAEAYSNMGVTLQDQGKLDEAIEAYSKALLYNQYYAETFNNKGITLQDQGKLDEAIEAYKKAISLKPEYAEAHQNLSSAFLNCGRLKEGLNENEWRWKTSKFLLQQRHFSQTLWDRQKSLNDKRILLWCEQGVGDTINWSSYLSLVSSEAEQCILECQDKLVPLLERSFPNVEVKAENRSLDLERDDFDFHLPMGSLHKEFSQEILKNTKPKAFLFPNPVRINFWRERLYSVGEGPYIGISWKSSNISLKRLPNYASISEWFPLLRVPNVTFINLQNIDFANDLEQIQNQLGITVHNFNDLDHYNNIDDVAALCAALDVVVSTKTTVPLISAGVGTSTKLANWRQSTWNNIYLNPVGSEVDIFEKDTWESWDNVFNLIAKDIFKLTKK